jgi:hypothetical protein
MLGFAWSVKKTGGRGTTNPFSFVIYRSASSKKPLSRTVANAHDDERAAVVLWCVGGMGVCSTIIILVVSVTTQSRDFVKSTE